MKKSIFTTLLITCILSIGFSQSTLSQKSIKTNESLDFGKIDEQLNNFTGKIYRLPNSVQKLPDFSKLTSIGEIYTSVLNIKKQSFRKGFPGITNRFEYFAIQYTGAFYMKTSAEMCFLLESDDGSKLYIDDVLIVNNDYLHAMEGKNGCANLTAGLHKIEVQYFQGPRDDLGLLLKHKIKGGTEFKPFDLNDFSPLKIKETETFYEVCIDNEILFDVNSYKIDKSNNYFINEIARLIIKNKYTQIEIVGHTDNTGDDKQNMILSLKRAQSLKNKLQSLGLQSLNIKLTAEGSTKPIADNTTPEGRQKNRRIELYIYKQ